ncbi:HAD hydrolase family protein, partial [uncultured Dubosiella sp.]
MVQIVYLDADGTLFHHEGYIPKSAFEAIRKAQEKGIKIVLCTGRQLVEIYGDMKKIDYDAVIAGAGGTVLVKEELLFDGRFSQEELERLR